MSRRGTVRGLMAVGLVGVLSGCQTFQSRLGTFRTDQRTADQRAAELEQRCVALRARRVTIEEEYSLGSAVSVNWVSQGGGLLLPKANPPEGDSAGRLTVQVNKIGRNLAAQSSRPTLGWTFGVLESPGINAVSAPGGYVFVSRGLLARLHSEAELAGVLAHEISHVTSRHALNEFQAYLNDECEQQVGAEKGRVVKEMAAAGVRGVQQEVSRRASTASSSVAPGAARDFFAQVGTRVEGLDLDRAGRALIGLFTDNFVARLLDKGLPEQAEYDADREALKLMAAAGYEPRAYIDFVGELPDSGLSTAHPRKELRQQRLRQQLNLWRAAADDSFTSSVDLTRLERTPLRDSLRELHRAGGGP